jgi:hypothetical protein
MVRIRKVIAAALCALASAVLTAAQTEDKPKAFLRQDAGGFHILVRTFAAPPAGSRLFAALTNGKGELLDLDTDVTDCSVAPPGKICKKTAAEGKTELVYRIARAPAAGDSFKMRYAFTGGAVTEKQLREVEALPDLRLSQALSGNCDNGILYTVETGEDEVDSDYLKERIAKFDEWLKRQADTPRGIASVEVQPHSSPNKATYAVRDYEASPVADVSPDPHRIDATRAVDAEAVQMCVRFQARLPDEKFDTLVKFENNNPPFELLFTKAATLDGSAGLIKTVSKDDTKAVVKEKELGLRGFDNAADIAFNYSTAVEDEKQLDGTFKRLRKQTGVFDVRVAPWLRRRLDKPETGTWQRFWTPAFLDAKVSTGKIDKDTHALNRINIGTEINWRYWRDTERGKRNGFFLTLRGVNASDRDFKRAELTSEFEFRPNFDALINPRSGTKQRITRVLKPDEDQIETAPLSFLGYQVQPFVGVNAGRTYRKKRTIFEGEEESDFVRRFFFGADIIFDLGPLFKVTLTDTFYVRGETPGDRGRNYFSGELEGSLGRIRRDTAQSLFVSFERGDQPPFTTRGANVVKLGYRIRSDFIKAGTVK